ncbi:hypothetical protein NQ176_g1009 [Zarea fungicola]|uniref:Uncharacterized protein n=1 Tax=Zarea fungicola TaxID=93591 RepID=A0ACC1NW29_9HYPO|nr:hypothetical protein NQ176_g1009 [Lecanicillium fungicola]
MLNILKTSIALGLFANPILARDVPANIRSLYNSIRAIGQCSNALKCGFYSVEPVSRDFCYCGDHLPSDGIVYLQGTGGSLVNMDINCNGGPRDGDGSCDKSTDNQPLTYFREISESYNNGSDLNAYVHPFVTFGNYGTKRSYPTFDPRSVGIEPYSIMAVVCGDKLVYGFWGDADTDVGPGLVGEAADSIGRYCYGNAVDYYHAHDDNDVLYIAFTGHDAVLGPDDAKWDAESFDEFQRSIQAQGDRFISRIGGMNFV